MLVSVEIGLNLRILKIACIGTHESQFSPLISQKIIGSDFSVLFGEIHPNLVLQFYEWATRDNHLAHFSHQQYWGLEEYVIMDAYRLENQYSIFINIQSQPDEKEVFGRNFKKFFFDNFEGGVLFVNHSGLVFDCTQRLLDVFQLKDVNGVLLTREAMLDNDFISLLKMNRLSDAGKALQDLMMKSNELAQGILSEDLNVFNSICRFFVTPVLLKRKMIGYYIFIHDLTDLHERDVLIEHQRAAIVSSSKLASLGEMAGGIAHEINNPLTIISSSVQLMKTLSSKGKLTTDEFNRISETINKTIGRITHIISSLRKLSRNSSDKMDRVLVKDIFSEVFVLCSERFRQNNISLKLIMNDDVANSQLLCDQVQLSQVLINLLNNAYDATEKLEEKWTNVLVTINNDRLVIEVMDSGVGISGLVREKIFQPFFTTKEIGRGTGIGLSISMNIVKNHQGNFFIDLSRPNTTFVIELPLLEKFSQGA